MKFPGVDCTSRTAGNNSTVTEEPIVLPDLPIMSDELFIAFAEDCFFHPIVQAICFKKYVESLNSCQTILQQKGLIFRNCTGIEQTI
jgi:hypothetical protein